MSRFSRTVRSSNSASSWNTMAPAGHGPCARSIVPPVAVATRPDIFQPARPFAMRPDSTRRSVDLPLPTAPTSSTTSPG